ncbi:MAG: hypothetical protein AB7O97_00955 [Planctomycetota bacterium]
MSDAAGLRFCARCEAALPRGTEVCVECGAAAAPAPEVRARDYAEFRRLRPVVPFLRTVLGAAAVASALLAWLWGEAATGRGELGTNQVLQQLALLVCTAAVSAVGAVRVTRGPFGWSLLGAAMYSATLLQFAWSGPLPGDPGVHTLMLCGLWTAVMMGARMRQLMRRHAKLQLERAPIDPSRRVPGGVAETTRARHADRGRRRRQRLAFVLSLAAALGVALYQGLQWFTAPAPIDGAAAAFARRLSDGDLDALVAELPLGAADPQAAALRDALARRGWDAAPPALADAAVEGEAEATAARFDTPDGPVVARFAWSVAEARWRLRGVDLPRIRAPDPAPTLDAFHGAWHAAGPDALLDLMRPAARERIGARIEELLARRELREHRPPLAPPRDRRDGPGWVRLTFTADQRTDLLVQFEYWHPRWVLEWLAWRRR